MDTQHLPSNPNLVEIPVSSLVPGMYISELDRPWLDTPFTLQGFAVQDEDDIAYVAKHCSYVFVDPDQSVQVKPKPANHPVAVKTVSLKKEFSRAAADFDSAADAMEKVFSRIQSSKRVDLKALQSAINPLIDSVMRNKDALTALVRIKGKGSYLYSHSLAVAVWSAVLGHHMGFDKESLRKLALGASVMDVGMADIDEELLNRKGDLTDEERSTVRAHVKQGVKYLRDSGLDDPDVLNLVACHHERHDGSGYPQQLAGTKIPTYARIAGLVDTFDAMTSNRPHTLPRSSFEAIQELNDLAGEWFQGSLVEQFIQCVGMFPTGSIVELNTGEVGVVVSQNPQRRLRPKIVLILGPEKQRQSEFKIINLGAAARQDTLAPSLWITKELETGAFGIKPDEYFL
jgi:HD-GYP domain-containing protein (c-di-GMP phosphodiesterase class II)